MYINDHLCSTCSAEGSKQEKCAEKACYEYCLRRMYSKKSEFRWVITADFRKRDKAPIILYSRYREGFDRIRKHPGCLICQYCREKYGQDYKKKKTQCWCEGCGKNDDEGGFILPNGQVPGWKPWRVGQGREPAPTSTQDWFQNSSRCQRCSLLEGHIGELHRTLKATTVSYPRFLSEEMHKLRAELKTIRADYKLLRVKCSRYHRERDECKRELNELKKANEALQKAEEGKAKPDTSAVENPGRRRLASEAVDYGSPPTADPRKALSHRHRRRLEELTGYPTISRILREEERSRRSSNLPPRT